MESTAPSAALARLESPFSRNQLATAAFPKRWGATLIAAISASPARRFLGSRPRLSSTPSSMPASSMRRTMSRSTLYRLGVATFAEMATSRAGISLGCSFKASFAAWRAEKFRPSSRCFLARRV